MRNRAARILLWLALAGALASQGCGHGPREVEAQKAPPPPPSLKYIGAWGAKGSDPGQLDKPTAIATDTLGNSFIPDDGANDFVHKFAPDGTPLLAFQDPSLKHPQSIDVDRGGAIYVSDPVRNSVFVYFPNGDRYREIHAGGRPNAENLLSVAVTDDGEVYVLDANAGKVFDYTPRFRLARSWPIPGGANGAQRHTGAIATTSDGYLYIADPEGNQILRCSSDGHLAAQIAANSGGVTRKLSDELAVGNKYVFVMDSDGRMIHVWTTDGKPELDADLSPQLGQDARYPPSIAVSPRGELLVLDDRANRVLRYQIAF